MPSQRQVLEKKLRGLTGELQAVSQALEVARAAAATLPTLTEREAKLAAQVSTLQDAIRVFEPDWDASQVRGNRPRNRSPIPRNAPKEHAVAMMRANPAGVTTAEIMHDLMRAHSVSTLPPRTIESLRSNIATHMANYQLKGIVQGVGSKPVRWMLVPKALRRERQAAELGFDV